MKYESKFKLAPFSMRWWWNESRRKVVCKAFCMHRAWKGQTYFFSLFICILLRLVCNQILRLPPPCLIAPPLITTHTSHITGLLAVCKKSIILSSFRYHCKVNFSHFLKTFYDFTRSVIIRWLKYSFLLNRIVCIVRERIKYDWV